MNVCYEGPRHVYPEEYDELMNLMEIAYGATRQYILNCFPYGCKREDIVRGDHFIIKENRKIVSHVWLLPMQVIAGKSRIKVGAIGSVATHPDYRRKGYMGRLLNYTLDRMSERKIPLSILWGDTQRYRHFGWEAAGKEIIFQLNQRSTNKIKVGKEFALRGYNSEIDLDEIIRIHEREPFKVERTKKNYEGILHMPHIQIWMGNEGNLSCYAVLNRNEVVEFGGDPPLVAKLFSFLLSRYPLDALYVRLPYRDNNMLRLLYGISSSWQISSLGMIKVVDLNETLLSFKSQIQEKAEIYEIPKGNFVTLKIKDSCQKVTLVREKEIEIRDEKLDKTVSLSEIELVRLLFGSSPEDFGKSKDKKEFLRAIFPLDFFVWPLDHI